jgi:2-hydroxy-3-oxopropionate reductase
MEIDGGNEMKIGFVGLGIMGRPMALNLIKAGHELKVFDVVPERMAGMTAAGSAREAAVDSEIVITMLPNSPEVRAAVCGAGGILEGAAPGTLLVDMSSIAPLAAREIAAEAAKRGVVMLDAPVSGGEPKAIEGKLAIMVGGPAAAFERARPVFEKMGASVTHVGEIGSGNVTKLANQIMVALHIAAMSEAMVLATKAGVNPENVYRAIRGGLAGSAVLDAKMPLALKGNFKPGFRIALHIKDLMNALDTAHGVGVPLPLTGSVLEFLQALKVDGHGGDDHGGLIQFYERLARVEVRGATS